MTMTELQKSERLRYGLLQDHYEQQVRSALLHRKKLYDVFLMVASQAMESEARLNNLPFNPDNPKFLADVKAQSDEIESIIRGDDVQRNRVVSRVIPRGTTKTRVTAILSAVRGLTVRDAVSAQMRRNEMLRNGLSWESADLHTKKYAQHLLQARINNIAVTETRKAISLGTVSAWNNVPRVPVKVFRLAEQDKHCGICKDANNQRVPLNRPFVTEVGMMDVPPLHPHCMCYITIEPT